MNVILVNAFVANGTGGNPAGVVLHADELTDTQKLHIAQVVGFSETAFVSQGEDVDFNVSFFTPTGEVDFCGHATLATFSLLYQKGVIEAGDFTQKTKAGVLGVRIEPNGYVVMNQRLPEFIQTFDYAAVAELLGMETEYLSTTHLPIEAVSTGLADVIVPVPAGSLDQLNIDQERLYQFSQEHNVVGIHAFELNSQGSQITASCRNFAPLVGIPEESATGSAIGALASYLTKYHVVETGIELHESRTHHFVFEQGRAMNCCSKLTASVESQSGVITSVMVGGIAQEFGQKTVPI